jgi:hypothetical protein
LKFILDKNNYKEVDINLALPEQSLEDKLKMLQQKFEK